MKTLITSCLVLILFGSVQAQVPFKYWNQTMGMNYGFMKPTGGMKQYIRQGHGFSMNYLLEAPAHRVAAGLEFNWTGYGHTKSTTDYEFPDGTSAPMEVNVLNSFGSLMATSRLFLVLHGPVRPYASVKAGYTWFRTNLTIVDPVNGDSCEPLESNVLSLDGTFAYSAGGGVRIDVAWLFKKAPRGRYYIDISSNMLQGGRVNYMNEKPPAQNAMHGTTRAREVEAQFINTETQVVHPHHVGYMYNSFVQMMDFRLGMTFDIRN